MTTILAYQNYIRLGCFLSILLIMMLLEVLSPRRQLTVTRRLRWTNNMLLVALNSVLLYLLLPLTAVDVALVVQKHSFGIFNYWHIGYISAVVISIIFLDLVIYTQHVIFHKVKFLWKIHRMHHTDLDIDVTTGSRFHPIEIIISMLLKISVIVLLGAPAISVILFEIILNGLAMFNHSNFYFPIKIDKYLRRVIVTPDMHRVHHSIEWQETNSNYGFNLSWWDRIFRTYIAQPQAGHTKMTIGIRLFRQLKYLNLWWLLLIPFKN